MWTETETAYHEAGHAVAYIVHRLPFRYVTIIPDQGYWGKVAPRPSSNFHPDSDTDDRTLRRMDCMVLSLLAGDASQAILKEGVDSKKEAWEFKTPKHVRAHVDILDSDWGQALDLAVRLHGGQISGLYLDYMWARTIQFVRGRNVWPSIEAVAVALLTEKKLQAARVREIHRETLQRLYGSPVSLPPGLSQQLP